MAHHWAARIGVSWKTQSIIKHKPDGSSEIKRTVWYTKIIHLKRLVSILLVDLLLYNMVGYSVVYWFGGNVTLESQPSVTETIAVHEYITVKIPVSLPYQTNWPAPQSVQGKLQAGNEFYEMVEQIMLNDTIYNSPVSPIATRAPIFMRWLITSVNTSMTIPPMAQSLPKVVWFNCWKNMFPFNEYIPFLWLKVFPIPYR